MDLEINFINFIDACGGMHNTVKIINDLNKYYSVYIKMRELIMEIGTVSYKKLYYSNYIKIAGDLDGISMSIGTYSYGFFRQKPPEDTLLIIKNYDGGFENFISDYKDKISIIKNRREEMNKKNIEIDPFEEEDWTHESFIIKRFDKFHQ